MYIYIIYFFILFIFSSVKIRNIDRNFIYFLISLGLILLAAFRDIGVDRDLENYLNLWKNYQNGISVSTDLFSSLIFRSVPNFTICLLIFSTLGVLLKSFAIIKLSSFPLISILFYYTHYFFLHEMTQIRAGVAVGLILLMIYYISNHEKKRAFLCFFLALGFHLSAIAALIIFFLNKNSINIFIYLIFLIVCIFLAISSFTLITILEKFHLGFISNKIFLYQTLMEAGEQSRINLFNFAFILQILIGIISLYLCNLNLGNKYLIILTKIYWIGIYSYLIFSFLPVLAFRISEIFLSVEFIIIPNIILLFKPKKLIKIIIIFLSAFYFILYEFILNSINPYKFNIFI